MALIPLDMNKETEVEPAIEAGPKIIPLEIKSDTTSVDPSKTDKNWKERIYANAKAAYAGALSFGSSLVKIMEKMDKGIHDLVPGSSRTQPILKGIGAEAQAAYEQAEKSYQSYTDKYPETMVSKFVGEMAASAPLYSSRPLVAGASLGSKLAGVGGKYLGAAAGGATTGALLGGLRNESGQSPTDVWNEDQAKSGAAIGALIGPIGGGVLSSWGHNTANYQIGKEALQGYGYQGPILARDFAADGVIKDVKNKLLDNIPMVTNKVRAGQQTGIEDAVKRMVGTVSSKSVHQNEARIGQLINATRNRMATEGDNLWSGLFNDISNSGIKKIPLSTATKTTAADVAIAHKAELSTADYNKFIKPLEQIRDASPQYLHQLKRDIWPLYVKTAKKESTQAENLANSLKDLYWKLDDDIGAALSANPKLEMRYKAAKEYSTNMFNIFDPKKDRPLANAIKDVNEKGENLRGFINSIMKPKTDRVSPYYDKVFGDTYSKAAQNLALKNSYMKALDYETGGLNLPTFFKAIEEQGGNNLIKGDTLTALKGLHNYSMKVGQAAEMANKSSARHLQGALPVAASMGAIGAATGASPVTLPTIGGAIASAAVLGAISKTSPLKNSLIALSRVWGKNPQMTEKIMDTIGRNLPQLGIILQQQGSDTKIYKDGK